MVEKLLFLLSSLYFHGSQFKNKINGKIEKGNVRYREYPARAPHTFTSSGVTFSSNFYPKQQGFDLTFRASLSSPPIS